jgi:hypothetical protein
MHSAITPTSTTSSIPTLLPRPQVHTRRPARWTSHPSLTRLLDRQLLCNRRKQLLHILRRLRAGLKEQQPRLSRVGFGVCGGHGALVRLLGDEIGFVAGEGDDDVLVCLALELLHPGFCFI